MLKRGWERRWGGKWWRVEGGALAEEVTVKAEVVGALGEVVDEDEAIGIEIEAI